jgi:hypothetical protein
VSEAEHGEREEREEEVESKRALSAVPASAERSCVLKGQPERPHSVLPMRREEALTLRLPDLVLPSNGSCSLETQTVVLVVLLRILEKCRCSLKRGKTKKQSSSVEPAFVPPAARPPISQLNRFGGLVREMVLRYSQSY